MFIPNMNNGSSPDLQIIERALCKRPISTISSNSLGAMYKFQKVCFSEKPDYYKLNNVQTRLYSVPINLINQ